MKSLFNASTYNQWWELSPWDLDRQGPIGSNIFIQLRAPHKMKIYCLQSHLKSQWNFQVYFPNYDFYDVGCVTY